VEINKLLVSQLLYHPLIVITAQQKKSWQLKQHILRPYGFKSG